jgi:hypothetical protein
LLKNTKKSQGKFWKVGFESYERERILKPNQAIERKSGHIHAIRKEKGVSRVSQD